MRIKKYTQFINEKKNHKINEEWQWANDKIDRLKGITGDKLLKSLINLLPKTKDSQDILDYITNASKEITGNETKLKLNESIDINNSILNEKLSNIFIDRFNTIVNESESLSENSEEVKKAVWGINDMVDFVHAAHSSIAVITGGEPLMHDLDELTSLLHEKKIRTHIETSGTHPLTGKWDWICFSPKKFKAPVEEAYEKASELKVIVNHPSDIEWAEMHATKVSKSCILYLQPEWSKRERFLPLIIDHVKKNPKWRVSLQKHKYMNIP